MKVAVLAGGVGAARLLSGLIEIVAEGGLTVVVNTGDDGEHYGLLVCPDLDTITYTLSGMNNTVTGWGLADETFTTLDALGRFGVETWFRVGDKDFATHLFRTKRLNDGATLSEVTAEVTAALGLHVRLVPMTNDAVRTRIALADGGEVDFQEYFVHLGHAVGVRGVSFSGADSARPAPGVIEALGSADAIVVAPSNPILSLGPILAVREIADTVVRRREAVVAISPIIAGAALKGPADRLLVELGGESSVVGVARLLTPYVGTLLIDSQDAHLVAAVEATGMRCLCTDTVMASRSITRALARTALHAVLGPELVT